MSEKTWLKKINKSLKGRTITEARYMTKAEAESLGWYSRAVVLQLNDGNILFPSMDDEGNNAGALFTNDPDLEVIPVFGIDD